VTISLTEVVDLLVLPSVPRRSPAGTSPRGWVTFAGCAGGRTGCGPQRRALRQDPSVRGISALWGRVLVLWPGEQRGRADLGRRGRAPARGAGRWRWRRTLPEPSLG